MVLHPLFDINVFCVTKTLRACLYMVRVQSGRVNALLLCLDLPRLPTTLVNQQHIVQLMHSFLVSCRSPDETLVRGKTRLMVRPRPKLRVLTVMTTIGSQVSKEHYRHWTEHCRS